MDSAILKLNNTSRATAGKGKIIIDSSITMMSGAATLRLLILLIQLGKFSEFIRQIPHLRPC